MLTTLINETTQAQNGEVFTNSLGLTLGIVANKLDSMTSVCIGGICNLKIDFNHNEEYPIPLWYDEQLNVFKKYETSADSSNKIAGFLMGCSHDLDGNIIPVTAGELHRFHLIGI